VKLGEAFLSEGDRVLDSNDKMAGWIFRSGQCHLSQGDSFWKAAAFRLMGI
jgi:hypothetical protein